MSLTSCEHPRASDAEKGRLGIMGRRPPSLRPQAVPTTKSARSAKRDDLGIQRGKAPLMSKNIVAFGLGEVVDDVLDGLRSATGHDQDGVRG